MANLHEMDHGLTKADQSLESGEISIFSRILPYAYSYKPRSKRVLSKVVQAVFHLGCR